MAQHVRAGDYDEALTWANRMDMPNWYVAPMLVASTAALAGRQELAERAAAQLLDVYPEFPQAGRELLGRWGIEDELEATFVSGLEAAGLTLE